MATYPTSPRVEFLQWCREHGAVFIANAVAIGDKDGHIRHADTADEAGLRPTILSIHDESVKLFIRRLIREFSAGATSERFPYLEVMIGLHAVSRRGSRLCEGNDLADVDHACAALPYCDAFLTEKGLTSRLTQSPLALDVKLGCKTMSKEGDVISYLESLN